MRQQIVCGSLLHGAAALAFAVVAAACGGGNGGAPTGAGAVDASSGSDAPQGGADATSSGDGMAQPPADGGVDGPGDGAVTTLPPLSVHGTAIQDPGGSTIVLRGVAVPDIGTLYTTGGGAAGITGRIDEVLGAAGLDAHIVRLPVYPRTVANSGAPFYSPLPFPVGNAAPATSGVTVTNLSAQDYVDMVLRPAVDYATSKNLYVIVDYHQIDNVTTGTSSADAVTFWTQIAPLFASYPNVLYEAFNEPIDNGKPGGWTAAFQTQAQLWITTIRAGAPNNIIVVGSPSWSQYPDGTLASAEGGAGYPLTGGNLIYTAHVYPGNWNTTFQNRVAHAATGVPVMVSEWGYDLVATVSRTDPNFNLETASTTWESTFQTFLEGNGASWTAWVADPSWGPPMFSGDAGLTPFGMAVQTWLATDKDMNWVQ